MKQWTSQIPKVHREWVEAIAMEASDKLTPWEIDFVNGIERTLDRRIPLTQFQEEKLEQIYSNYTS